MAGTTTCECGEEWPVAFLDGVGLRGCPACVPDAWRAVPAGDARSREDERNDA